MPPTTHTQAERRTALRRLLESGPATNQQQLVEALTAEGFVATQSSVSRDLKELRAVRTGRGYELPDPNDGERSAFDEIGDMLREMTPAGPNLLVVRTATGAAQRVALALDRSPSPDIVGTVAGDDTVFVATPDARSQRRVMARLRDGSVRR